MKNTRIRAFAVRRSRKLLPPTPKIDGGFTLDVIKTHGRLYYGYQKCIGNRTLKAAYWPTQKGWHTFALWAVTIIPPFILFALFCFDWRWASWNLIIQAVIFFGLAFPLANYCLRQGLMDDLLAVGITGERTMQPWNLHYPILRLMWFHSHVTEREKISHNEIKRCMEFVDFISKDAPPSWTSYFRHPLTLLIIGIGVYTFNTKLAQLLNSTAGDADKFFSHTLAVVVQALGFGLLLHAWRYYKPESRWSFLRCLRWIELSMRP